MRINDIIEKIGKDKIIHWILLFSIGLFCVGIFQFFYIWMFKFQLENYLNFAIDYSFKTYVIMFTQVYSVLFIPLLCFIGFKYKDSDKFNSVKYKGLILIFLLFIFNLCAFYFKFPLFLLEWGILFTLIYTIISFKFNPIFSLSFSYLCFFGANMLFEMQGINFFYGIGTNLAYIVVFGITYFILYKLKLENKKYILISFLPILFMWIYYYNIWELAYDSALFYNTYIHTHYYIRLFTFPFYITISLIIYFTYRKKQKSYIALSDYKPVRKR